MKRFFITSATILALVAFLTNSAVSGPSVDARKTASEQFSTAYPQVQLYHTGTQITHIYGHVFGTGSSPEDAAEQFRQQYAPILGVDPSELHPTSFVISSGNTQGVMYENGRYKFTLVYYSQYKDGIPVYKADLRLLVRNEAGYPLVLASSAIKDLGDFSVDASKASIDPRSAQATFAIKNPQYIKFGEPRQVIWAGTDEAVTPAFGIEFMADDGNDPTVLRDRVIIDPITAEIIYQESMVTDVNVTGQVTGLGTQGFLAEQCGSEISRPLPYATASIIGGNSAYADSNGNFTITNSGSTAVTVWSRVKGHWFIANNQQGASDSLAMSVTPPGPANFVHNAANTEYKRAEVNAYLHANIVRDFTLHYNPTYPTIYSQTNFPLHCNDNTGYCPGNAWYDGISLTFCLASSPYPNTAFSTVVHHEYGHHLVECAGSGQDQYGEGMGDVMGLLITDDPGTGYGFFGSCSEPLRSADNTLQYPCSGEVHACAPLMSGCVWSIRNQLIVSNPTTYMNILANLAINAMLVHTGGTITPQIAIDYLTLDDDDGNIDNGTPHHSEICTGFSAHNMDCPALILMTFS
ncbi:MAG TPA: hypothetical protein DEO84_04505, partial [candidate division Zixibacteria bacterium]|nr:hypothetical protein [candidate division Zixibacteria bacterium]